MQTKVAAKRLLGLLGENVSETLERHRHSAELKLAKLQIAAIQGMPNSPFERQPRPNHLRGIDFYDEDTLLLTMARYMRRYHRAQGVLPKLIEPVGFSEKICWSNFFAEMRVPESGNKLLTSSFIPASVQGMLKCPEIVWHSRHPDLPRNEEFEPGSYYLKAAHGSSMCRRISYPLSEEHFERLQVKCRQWLAEHYGFESGEWWYCAFDKEVLIERDVCGEDHSVSWYFYVFSGKIGFIVARRKSGNAGEGTWFDQDFEILPYQTDIHPPITNIRTTENAKARMRDCALAIGKDHSFVRVDLMLGPDEQIYLGEITFSPCNGYMPFPPEFDLALGEMWRLE